MRGSGAPASATGDGRPGGLHHPLRIAAVVLAAGRSSRMGAVKALTAVGDSSALARVAGALRAAGVEEIVVVTGYHAEQVAPEAARIGLAMVYNPQPEKGMFSSIMTGVAALEASADAFLVLPVDYALTRPATVASLAQAFAADATDIIHPMCAGVRGHPPLVTARLRQALLASSADADLRTFLATHAQRSADVDVDDLTILLDMDTPADLERMRRFAAVLGSRHPATDGASAGDTACAHSDAEPHQPVDHLSEADAQHILALLQAPYRVVAHCQAVASVGEALAIALSARMSELDVALVRTACLLHDMVRGQGARKHALLAARILENLGLPRLAAVVGAHMVLPVDPGSSPLPTEAELVYLADKMVVDARPAGLHEREERALAKHAGDHAVRAGLDERMRRARVIAGKVEAIVGRPIEEIVMTTRDAQDRDAGAATRPPRPLPRRVFLVRHAEPVMPVGPRRFLGQTDPPLAARGITQAKELAQTLAHIPLAGIYSSDLKRSRQTASILATGRGLKVEELTWLREIDAGRWEMLTFEQARELYPHEYAARERDLAGSRFPGGESLRDVEARVLPGFLALLEGADQIGTDDLLIVGHRAVNVVLLSHLLGRPLSAAFDIKQEYCAVSVIETGPAEHGSRWFAVNLRGG